MAELDPQIHPPARLKLMTTLTGVSQVEFATLRDALEVSDSVLSKHLSALAAGDDLTSRKGVHRGRRTTWVAVTETGRAALGEHVAALPELIAGVAAPGPSRAADR